MTEEELVEHYLEQKKSGLDFSEIRKELSLNQIPEERIKEIVRKIDYRLLAEVQINNALNQRNTLRNIGIFLLVFGIGITVSTFLGWINMGESFVLVYGPIISGVTLIAVSLRPQTSYFDRKRGFRKR